MGNYEQLKQAVADVIKANGRQEITGNVLQQTLLSMVNALGLGAQFMGFATVITVPGLSEAKRFFLATNIGTYKNFNNFVLSRGVALFTNSTGVWVGTQIDIPNMLDINGYAVQQSPTLNYVIGYINTTNYKLNYTPTEPLNKVIKLNVTPGQVLYVKNDRADSHNYMLDGNGELVRRLYLSAGTTKITVGENEAVFWFAVSYKSAPGDPTKQDIYTVPKGLENITTALESVQERIKNVTTALESVQESVENVTTALESVQESVVNIEKVTDNFEVVEKISKLNLLNPDLYVHGVYIDADNILRGYPTLSVSGFIPVVAGQQYRIFGMSSNGEQGNARYVNFYTGAREHIPGTQVRPASTIIIPEGCEYIRCANYNGLPPSATSIYDLSNTGVMLGASPTFEKYFLEKAIHYDSGQSFTEKGELTLVNKSDIQQAISDMGEKSKLTVEFANPGITVKRGSDFIEGTLNKYAANNPNYEGNPMFNFIKWKIGIAMNTIVDDVAPMHVQNTTIGANHAQPCMIGTINAHRKDNTAIGTGWTHTDGTKFYIMRIVDENRIVFLSENKGTPENQTFVNLSTGTLTNGSQTMTVSAVASTQLFESVFNVKQKVLQNGVTEITEAQTFGCDFVDVVEEYDIVNTAEVLKNIIARAGQTGNPVYTSNPMIHVENIYRFLPNLSVVVTTNVIANQTVKMNDIMFCQASPVSMPLKTKYYAPNSLPVAGLDFRKPLEVRWGPSVPSIYFTSFNWADVNNPVNRIVQIATAVGFAVGFLKAAGVGKDLKTFTGRTFELRNTSGKVYPHGVDSIAQGDTLTPGKMYTAVMYRCFFDVAQPANRLSMYNCTFNGAEYVFVDYSATTLDRVVVDAALDGKQIEVVEAKNAELKTDVYNNGFYVNATYVEDETCFIVVKIG